MIVHFDNVYSNTIKLNVPYIKAIQIEQCTRFILPENCSLPLGKILPEGSTIVKVEYNKEVTELWH